MEIKEETVTFTFTLLQCIITKKHGELDLIQFFSFKDEDEKKGFNPISIPMKNGDQWVRDLGWQGPIYIHENGKMCIELMELNK